MSSKLPLLPSGPGGVRKSTFHGPWQKESAARAARLQGESGFNAEKKLMQKRSDGFYSLAVVPLAR
jgi:hypothetical protein